MEFMPRLVMLLSESSSFISEWLAGWNIGALILIIIGVVLIIIEMLLPGIGLAGISGVVALVVGLFAGSDSLVSALFTLSIVVVLLLIAALIIFKFIFGGKGRRSRLILKDAINSGSRSEKLVKAESDLLGKKGIALTPLRPSGSAIIDDRHCDVLSAYDYIEKGAPIVVCEIRGTSILVALDKSRENAANEKS